MLITFLTALNRTKIIIPFWTCYQIAEHSYSSFIWRYILLVLLHSNKHRNWSKQILQIGNLEQSECVCLGYLDITLHLMTILPTFEQNGKWKMEQPSPKLVKPNDTGILFSLQLEQESFIIKPFPIVFHRINILALSIHWLKKSGRILQNSHWQMSRSEFFPRHLPFEPAILLCRKNLFSSGVRILAPIPWFSLFIITKDSEE